MTDDDTPEQRAIADWPSSMKKLARVIGPDATEKLIGEFGGMEGLYIPSQPSGRHKPGSVAHKMKALIGDRAFELLCGAYGGSRIDLPRGANVVLKKNIIADNMHLSINAAARKAGVTSRYVRAVRRAIGAKPAAKR